MGRNSPLHRSLTVAVLEVALLWTMKALSQLLASYEGALASVPNLDLVGGVLP